MTKLVPASVSGHADQSHAQAGNDLVGGNKINYEIHYGATQAAGVVEQLLQTLHQEMSNDQTVRDTIDRLQRFQAQRAPDGIAGLQAKLIHAGRHDEYEYAIELKEMFAKLLERWSHYASAQQIFAYLLARAEQQFRSVILPEISSGKSEKDINWYLTTLIVEPTVKECCASVFEIDHNIAMGMIYWLAEQCFVRWHK